MCGDKMDILNRMAGRIDFIVKNIGEEQCDVCEDFFVGDYRGKCLGYSWNISYNQSSIPGEPGTWYFGMFKHKEEVWYIHSDGTIVDIILKAYEHLASGKWKERAKELREKKGIY